MLWLRRLFLLLPGRRAARERELSEELKSNLSLAIEDAGDPVIARRDFGNITRAQEEARAVWLPGWDAISQDLRFALRVLRRAPVFTLVAVLSLALGTGAATALFSLVDTIVLKPLSYRDPEKLVMIREIMPPLAHIYPTVPVNMQHFRYWRELAQSFDSLAAATSGTARIFIGDEPEVAGTALVTAGIFDTLAVPMQLGRGFAPEDERTSNGKPIVITDGFWRKRFHADPGILGKTLRVENGKCPIIGVLPASFRFPRKSDLGPLTGLAERTDIFFPLQNYNQGWGGDFDYIVFARLKAGIAPALATSELDALESRIVEEHKLSAGLRVQMRPLQEVMSSPVRTGLQVLLAAVMLLVLIVCVNLANLLLARGGARAREYALRIAIGATRGRLLVSALAETVLLAIAGGISGVIAARGALAAFVRTAPVDLPRMDEVRIDGRVMAFAVGLSLLCGLLFGMLPALRLSRSDPQSVLRGESHTLTGGRSRLRLREWLVGGEVALSTVLLVLAGLLVSSLWHVLRVDRGFTMDQAVEVRVELPSRYNGVKARAGFFDLAMERIRALPGVRSVSAVNKVPLTGESNVNSVRVKGQSALDPVTRQLVMVNVRFIGEDYFPTLGIPLVRGRAITAADRERKVAMVSQRLAEKLWPGENPLGKAISSGSFVGDAEVIGVVGDVHSTRLERDPTMMIYAPFWQSAFQVSNLVVRAAGDSRVVIGEVRRAVQAIDPGIPAPRMRTMGEIVEESVAQRRFQMRIAVVFAGAALLLAALGIYGVVAYGIALRRRELGIRMALGARAAEVRRMVLVQGLRPVFVGLIAGMLAAVAAGSLVRTLLFGIAANDGLTLTSVTAVLALVAALACLLPAQSAASIDPARVLREE